MFERKVYEMLKLTGEGNKKEGMSKNTKTLFGLGALVAVGIGGLLLKKRIDTKSIERLLIKSGNVDMKSLDKIAK